MVWRSTPPDAKLPIALGLAMPPLLVLLWRVAAWAGGAIAPWLAQPAGRLVFGLSITAVTVGVAWQMKDRRPWIGNVLEVFAIGFGAAGVTFVLLDAGAMGWRVVTLLSQILMVIGWASLWRYRRKWLSRAVARAVTLVSAVMLALHVSASFVLSDPVLEGVARYSEVMAGIIDRTVHPALAALPFVLWPIIWSLLTRYLRRHGPSHA